MKWFKHDSDANMDGKLQGILLDYGLEGYGLYWYCLELIVNKIDVDNLTFELEHDSRIIARNTGSSVQRVTEMMTRFIDLGLFQNIEGKITCLKLLNRLDKSMTSNARMRGLIESAKKSHDPIMMKPDLVMQDKIRIDKNRIEEIRINKDLLPAVSEPKKVKRFTPPTVEQIIEYCNQRQNAVDANKFLDHYDSAGWMRGKTKIKCWKACVRTWENNSSNQAQAKFAKPAKPGMYEQTMNIEDF
jgi:hypothetical protein